jgi:hypothetical protein
MTSRRRRCAATTLALLLAAAGTGRDARAQSAEELTAARELFQDAYRDEQGHHFAAALEKFQRVAAVKESAAVRYRIASVLGSLGRLREARDAFRALAALKPSFSASDQEISDSAAERAQALDHRIPRLVIQLQEAAPPDVRVTLDGAPIPASVTPRPFEVDPGEHVVQASARAAQASATSVTLPEGSEVAVTVVLPLRAPRSKPAIDAPAPSPARDHTVAFVALGTGAALLATGIVFLTVRAVDISDLEKACRDTCPSANRIALESKRDEALLFGPLGVGFGVVGLVVATAGVYLRLRPPPSAHAAFRPPSIDRLRLESSAVTGGAVVGLGASF